MQRMPKESFYPSSSAWIFFLFIEIEIRIGSLVIEVIWRTLFVLPLTANIHVVAPATAYTTGRDQHGIFVLASERSE
jgi:hypothetical protein